MWVLCVRVWSGACGCVTDGQWVHRGSAGHADSSRHPFTVKGQGGASCGLGLDDVAVRDLQPESPDAGRGRRRKSHSHVWRVSECVHELTSAPLSPKCVSSILT